MTSRAGCALVGHILPPPPPALQSHRESSADIAATLAAVEESLDLSQVYQARTGGRRKGRAGACGASRTSRPSPPAPRPGRPRLDPPPRPQGLSVPGSSPAVFRLRSMVCYYGSHYVALLFTPDLGAYLQFDDAAISRVGSWTDVRRKCEVGRIQPALLFFVRQ